LVSSGPIMAPDIERDVDAVGRQDAIKLPFENPFLVLLDPNVIPAQLFVFVFFILFGLLVYGPPGVTVGIGFFLCYEVAMPLGYLTISRYSFYEISVHDVVLHTLNSRRLRSVFRKKQDGRSPVHLSFYQPFYLEGTTLGVICAQRGKGAVKRIKLGVYPRDLFEDLVDIYSKPSA